MRLKSILISILFAVICFQFAFAQNWNEYRPEGCRCMALVPKTPDYSVKDVPSDVGVLKMHQYLMDYGEYAFLLTYTDYPKTLTDSKTSEQILEDVVKGSVGDGQMLRKTDLTIDTFPGKEYIARKADFSLKGRVFLVNQRLYQLISVYPPGKADALSSDVEEFLRSFRLLH
jgi:hypothetical protein